jgi:hypothetical protein
MIIMKPVCLQIIILDNEGIFIQKTLDFFIMTVIIKLKEETLIISYSIDKRNGVLLCPFALIIYFRRVGLGQTHRPLMDKFSWRKKIPFYSKLIDPWFRLRRLKGFRLLASGEI